MSRDIYAFGNFRLDPAQRRLEGPDGEAVALTAKPFDALVHLVEHAGVPVSRKALIKAVWPDTVVEDNNLTQAISSLRSALGKGYIITLPGRGYQFVGDVRTVERDSRASASVGDASAQHTRSSPPGAGAGPQPASRRWPGAAAFGIVGLLALVAGFYYVNSDAPTRPISVLPNSIAVLPLENLSPDPDNAHYAAGLHEEILNQLSKLKRLNVISRTSVLRYAENRPPIPEIARELNVQNVIEGSVRFAEGRIRVAMQLIDGSSDQPIWAETYDGGLADMFGVQSDIATSVANAMSVELSLEEQQDLGEFPGFQPHSGRVSQRR